MCWGVDDVVVLVRKLLGLWLSDCKLSPYS